MKREWLILIAVAMSIVLTVGTGCKRVLAPKLTYNATNASELRRNMAKSVKSEAGVAAVVAEPTGWATLKGKFTLNGPAPPRPPLRVDKDLEVCAAPGVQLTDESVVIGTDNGIKNVLVYVSTAIPADNPKWEHESYASEKTAQLKFDQKNCQFLSHLFAMRATQKLSVLNSDPVGHNTNLNSTRGAMSGNFTVPSHGDVTYEPKKPTPVPFSVSCSIHTWMRAWIMVCDHPYFAVTGDDGSFEIKNIPAGVPLEFRVWQERATSLQDVSVNGSSEKWNRGKFKKTLTPDKTEELNVVLEPTVFK